MSITSWSSAKRTFKFPELKQNLQARVIIVGGGLTGLLAAYLLRDLGPNLALVEEDKIGGHSVTEYTTAFLTARLDTSQADLAKMYGSAKARQIWESGMAAVKMFEKIIEEEKIRCEFLRVPAIEFPYGDFDPAKFHEIPEQAKFHPIKFLNALAEILSKSGVRIYQGAKIEKITGQAKARLVSDRGLTLEAEKVLVATYDPVEIPSNLFAKKGRYKTYVLELEVPKKIFSEAIYWDNHNPYYYFRVDRGEKTDRVILGGGDHRAEIKLDKNRGFKNLEKYFSELFPGTKYRITKKWTGLILEGSDGLALIGEYKPGRFVATAFSGNGMTYAMITAMMFRDYVRQKKNPWAKLYNPKRPRRLKRYLKKGWDYTQELFGGAGKNLLTPER